MDIVNIISNMNLSNSSNTKKKILVFDVETTGLLPKKSQASISPISIDNYPYIIQLSFILYDMEKNNIDSCYDAMINIPENIFIPLEVSELTGIYTHMCHYRGEDIINALIAFEIAYKQCNCIVAHNMDFDIEMILAEIERNRAEILSRAPQCFTLFQPVYERVSNIERYCTMRKGTNICNIAIPSKTEGKPPRKKWPKLSELHSHLFNGEQAKGLHNSFIDVMICLKCYLKMTEGTKVISNTLVNNECNLDKLVI